MSPDTVILLALIAGFGCVLLVGIIIGRAWEGHERAVDALTQRPDPDVDVVPPPNRPALRVIGRRPRPYDWETA